MLLYPLLKYNALGDLDILMTFAFLPTIGTSYAITGMIDWSVLYIALPVGLITDGILHANNTRDMNTDKRAGIVTMAMCMGKKSAAWLYAFEVTFPYIWILACVIMGVFAWPTVLVLLTVPMAIKCAKTMLKGYQDINAIAMLDMQAAQLQMAFSVVLSIALIVSKFIA
jgi:1,4-dihydroxy-2-naphthoate octaprenyltransferase